MYRIVLLLIVVAPTACEGTLGVPQSEYDPATGEPTGATFGSPATDPSNSSDPSASGGSGTDTGRQLYELHCQSCHGPEGSGTAVWSSSIAGYEPIDDIVANGRGAMQPVDVTADEISAIQAYLLSLAGGTAPAVDISTLDGIEVYELRCETCHGERGEGGDRGFQLRYRADDYSQYVVRHGRASDQFPSDMPAYDDISDAQLDEMFEWLGNVPNPSSGEELYARYCANCHGMDGRGGPTGKKIASKGDSTEKIREGENLDRIGDRREFMPRWDTENLSDADVDRINAWVDSLPD